MTNWDEITKLYNIAGKRNKFGYQVDEISEAESRLKTAIPKVLKDYYFSLGKNEAINNSHNRLLKPNQEIEFSDDGYLVFYEENQASTYWGIAQKDLTLDNPPVWGNYGTNESPDWHLESKTIDNFLLLMGVYNGTLGGLRYNANYFEAIDPETVKEIENNWKVINEISWDSQKIYSNDFKEVLSLSFDKDKNCTAIFIGTSYKKRFDNLLQNLNIDWSYTSYEDD